MARDFDGSSGYLSVGDNDLFDVTAQVTIHSWLIMDVLDANRRPICSKGTGATDAPLRLWNTTASYQFYLDLPESVVRLGAWEPAGGFVGGTLYNIIGSYNKDAGSNQLKAYVDGVNVASGTDTSTMLLNTEDFWVAKRSTGSNEFLNGKLSYFVIWDVQLTPTESLALSNGINPFCIRNSNIIIYVPIMGNDDPEADWSGNGLNMTVNGTTAKTPNPPVELIENYL